MSYFDREDDPDFFFEEQERMRRLRRRETEEDYSEIDEDWLDHEPEFFAFGHAEPVVFTEAF